MSTVRDVFSIPPNVKSWTTACADFGDADLRAAAPRLLDAVELPAHDRDQIVRVRDLLEPVVRPGPAAGVVALLEEPPVRDRVVLLRDRDDDLGGHLLVRRVVE